MLANYGSAQGLAHNQQAVAFAGLKRLALSRLKAGQLSFDFKLLDGRAVDHSETKAPARAGAKYQGVRTEQPEATTHVVPRRRRRFDLKSVHPARPHASGLFVAVCVGGLKVLVRARRMPAAWPPRSSFFRSFLAVLQTGSPLGRARQEISRRPFRMRLAFWRLVQATNDHRVVASP